MLNLKKLQLDSISISKVNKNQKPRGGGGELEWGSDVSSGISNLLKPTRHKPRNKNWNSLITLEYGCLFVAKFNIIMQHKYIYLLPYIFL